MAEILIGNVKGPQGETGATGATGPQGVAATVNVGTVSTTAYGNAAQVTNSGTENDAVLDFVIPQGRPGERTTTIGSLTLDTITTSTDDFPSPAVGDTGATAFGKIVKFNSDALTAIQGKLDEANVVNNLTTTEAGYALDARQGKALNDAMNTLATYGAVGQFIGYNVGTSSTKRIGYTIQNEQLKLVEVSIDALSTGAALTTGNTYSVGNLAAFHPVLPINFVMNRKDSGHAACMCSISQEGVFQLHPLESVPSGVTLAGHVMYYFQ